MPETVHHLRIPTSLPISDSNAYLIEGDTLTLVDTGVDTGEAQEALLTQIRALGHELRDVQKVILTHAHVDHFGLAAFVKEESGAEVYINELEKEFAETYLEAFERRRVRFRDEFKLAGVPTPFQEDIERFFDYMTKLARPCEIDANVSDGQRLRAGSSELTAIHTPGHSDGSTCFMTTDGDLFSGDTLLRDVSWNFTMGGTDVPASGISDYSRSLKRIANLELGTVYPGHFRPFGDPAETISRFLDLLEFRRGQILKALECKSLTAFEVAQTVYGIEDEQDVILALSQVTGMLKDLAEAGHVEKDGDTVPNTYSRP